MRAIAALLLLVPAVSAAELYPPLQPAWEFSAAGGFYAAPAIVGETLYVAGQDGVVYALNAADGQVRWRFETGSANYSGVAIGEGLGYVAASGGTLYAIDLQTGEARWQAEVGGTVYATPVVAGGLVLIGQGDGKWVKAYDAASGEQRWQFPLGKRMGSALSASDELAFLPSYDMHLYAVELSTMRLRWQYVASQPIDSAPLLDGDTLYVKLPSDELIALDAATGKELWKKLGAAPIGAEGEPSNWSPLRKSGELLLFGSKDGMIHAVRATDGEPVWTTEQGADRPAPPAIAGSLGFAGGRDGAIDVVDLADGHILWAWSPETAVTPGLVSGIMWPPVIDGDHVFASSMDGKLYAFRGFTDRQAWERWLEEREKQAAEKEARFGDDVAGFLGAEKGPF